MAAIVKYGHRTLQWAQLTLVVTRRYINRARRQAMGDRMDPIRRRTTLRRRRRARVQHPAQTVELPFHPRRELNRPVTLPPPEHSPPRLYLRAESPVGASMSGERGATHAPSLAATRRFRLAAIRRVTAASTPGRSLIVALTLAAMLNSHGTTTACSTIGRILFPPKAERRREESPMHRRHRTRPLRPNPVGHPVR